MCAGAATALSVWPAAVAGLTLHGGYGHLRRKHGLSVDSLLSVQIVTADGEVRTASATENPDLFWAVRGAGSNFGVVTSFEFRAHPIGPVVQLCAPFYPLDQGRQVLRGWREFTASAPDEVSSVVVIWSVPDVDGFPPEHRGRPVVIVAAVTIDQWKSRAQAAPRTPSRARRIALTAAAAALVCAFAFMLLRRAPASGQDRKVIAILGKASGGEYWLAVRTGAERKGQELGVDVLWQGPSSETEIQKQLDLFENLIQRGVDAIGLAPTDAGEFVGQEVEVPYTADYYFYRKHN